MADRTAGARLRGGQRERFRHARGTSVDQNRVGTGVKILLHPSQILAALFARPAVATGRFATNRSDKLVGLERGGAHFCGRAPGQVNGDSRERMEPVKCATAHVPTLAKSDEATPDNTELLLA